jgi:hypothetical protein
MKKQFHNLKHFLISGMVLVSLTFISCAPKLKILVETDAVYSTKRISLKYYSKDDNKNSPLIYLQQSIVKEIKANDEITYTVFDILAMNSESFNLQEKVFVIVDKEVYPMIIGGTEYEYAKNVTENKTDLLLADSTTVSVVTGYSENNMKKFRFSYNLSDTLISKIQNSDEVLFRYYSGPAMLTVPLKDRKLEKVKQLITWN